MPEALSQTEVDALLSLVESMDGGGKAGAPGEARGPSLATVPPGSGAASSAPSFRFYNALPTHQINIYDFKRPERVSKSQVIALEALHEVFARNLSASLSGYLRTIIEVRLISVEQFTYSEFTMSLPIPTSFNLLSCAPLDGHIILEVNPSILFPIIDRLLGGGRTGAQYAERPFTNIELSLVNTILARVIGQMRETWESVKAIDFTLFETESNPFLLQIVAPNEPVVLLSFEALMGEYSGMVNICIPFKVIEPIMPEFSQSNWFSAERGRNVKNSAKRILASIRNAPAEIAGILAETPISLCDILSLAPGDILDTGRKATQPVLLTIQGKKKYRCVPGVRGQRKVLRLTEAIDPSDPLLEG